MKKSILILTAIFISTGLLACKNDNGCNAKTSRVLEIKSERYTKNEVNHIDDISDTVIVSISEEKIGSKKQISFADKKMNVEYVDTYEYILQDCVIDRYKIINQNESTYEGETESYIMLYPDGTIYSVVDSICVLDISNNDNADIVKEKIICELGDFIDFGGYECCDVSSSLNISDAGRFGGYYFVWSNKYKDFVVGDYLKINIRDDGTVFSVWMPKPKYENVSDKSIEADRSQIIEKKLDTIYNTSSTRLYDYEIAAAQLVTYEKETRIKYDINVHWLNSNGKIVGEVCSLIVSLN